jgi:hypothetical protein
LCGEACSPPARLLGLALVACRARRFSCSLVVSLLVVSLCRLAVGSSRSGSSMSSLCRLFCRLRRLRRPVWLPLGLSRWLVARSVRPPARCWRLAGCVPRRRVVRRRVVRRRVGGGPRPARPGGKTPKPRARHEIPPDGPSPREGTLGTNARSLQAPRSRAPARAGSDEARARRGGPGRAGRRGLGHCSREAHSGCRQHRASPPLPARSTLRVVDCTLLADFFFFVLYPARSLPAAACSLSARRRPGAAPTRSSSSRSSSSRSSWWSRRSWSTAPWSKTTRTGWSWSTTAPWWSWWGAGA